MEREMCFICGMTISRGNRSEVNQSKMDKLVSVQRTVDHSSTIICDILSRILNETVMGEENVCRLCFNLLNDIDYHLKEAQEKTDEITAKFLDKEKDPLRYNPELKLLDPRRGSRKEKSRGGGIKQQQQQISPGLVTQTIQTEQQGPASVRPRSPSHVPVKGGGKGQSFFKSPERMKSPKKKHSPGKSFVGGDGSDDEMSEKKRRLLSRVLAPASKRARHPSSGAPSSGGEEEERRLTIDMEEEMLRKIRKKEKKMKRREKRRRQLAELEQAERAQEQAGRLRGQVKREEKIVPDHNRDNSDLDNDYIQDISEPEDNTAVEISPNTSAKYSSPSKTKSEDIQTVDLSQLGDLFSQEYPQLNSSSQENSSSHVFAKKSIPTTSSQQQQQLQQHQVVQQPQQQQPVYIVQEPGVTSITLHPGQPFPIIDCRNIVTGAAVSEAALVVDSPHISPDVSPSSLVTKSPGAGAVKSKTEAESGKKGGVAAGVPNVPCPHCDKKFMRGYNMRVHIERVHNKSKPWQCQFCEKTFATTSDLKQHLSSHGMGKIHKCEDCGREFTNRDSAILHRKQHNNERTHWCQDCGKGFFKASCLQRHMRSHTGEKPYHCEFCNRGFSQVTTLKNHKKVCKAAEKTIGEAEFTIDDADVKPN